MNFLYKYLIPIAQAEEVQRVETAQGVLDAFNRVVDLFTSIIVVLAIVYIIYNGFMFVSASGDENKISDAKKQIIYSLIAVLLIILASSAFRIVGDIIAGGNSSGQNDANQEERLPPNTGTDSR